MIKLYWQRKLKSLLVIELFLLYALQGINCFEIPDLSIQSKHYICYKAGSSLKIDGEIKESDWEKAEWSDNFVDIKGEKKGTPFCQTKVKMLWDDQYLYIGAYLEENDLWSVLEQRDDIVYFDNDFEVFIDPDDDTHDYCELELNCLNTVWDLLIIKPYRDRNRVAYNSWDIKGLKTAVFKEGTVNNNRDEDKYWSVEIAIPWTSLSELTPKQVPPIDNDLWKINYSRVQWPLEKTRETYQKVKGKAENNWVWSPQGLVAMHYPEQWGTVQFSHIIAGEDQAEAIKDSLEAEKKFLRVIYYAQKQYREKHKKFAESYQILKKEYPFINSYSSILDQYKLCWKIGEYSYEINLLTKKREPILHIYEDGRLIDRIDWDH